MANEDLDHGLNEQENHEFLSYIIQTADEDEHEQKTRRFLG